MSFEKDSIRYVVVVESPSRVWLWPQDRSTPGLPALHHLPEPAQTHVHRVGDAIQPPHPLSSPSPPALNLSQHQGLFQWVSSSHQVAKVLEPQHQSFQWIFRADLLWGGLGGSPCVQRHQVCGLFALSVTASGQRQAERRGLISGVSAVCSLTYSVRPASGGAAGSAWFRPMALGFSLCYASQLPLLEVGLWQRSLIGQEVWSDRDEIPENWSFWGCGWGITASNTQLLIFCERHRASVLW